MKIIQISLIALIYLAAHVEAQENSDNGFILYEPPAPLIRKEPIYPASEARRGGEGWVVINFMVDQQGDVFDAEVIDSSGGEAFEKASLRAVLDWEYDPANSDGEPIESGATTMLTFVLGGINAGPRKSFVSTFEKSVDAIQSNDWEEVEVLTNSLKELPKKNLFESSLLNYLQAAIASNEGNIHQEYKFLAKSLQGEYMHEQSGKFLPEALVKIVRRRLFVLQIELRYYAEALNSYIRLAQFDESFAKSIAPTINKINTLKTDDTAYWIKGHTDENGRWLINLLKKTFSVQIDEDAMPLQELKLHCNKKYAFFTFKNGEQYQIPESWGECDLIVLGLSNSEFTLWQQ